MNEFKINDDVYLFLAPGPSGVELRFKVNDQYTTYCLKPKMAIELSARLVIIGACMDAADNRVAEKLLKRKRVGLVAIENKKPLEHRED